MTAFFSTAEQYTASAALGATLAFAPALLAMAAPLASVGGGTVRTAGAMGMAGLAQPRAGVAVQVAGAMDMAAAYRVAVGAIVGFSPEAWTFGHGAMAAAGGGWAGTVTDVLVLQQASTAEFSTAKGKTGEEIVRVGHQVAMHPVAAAFAGAVVTASAEVSIVPNSHGPVARPRAVQGQVIMS